MKKSYSIFLLRLIIFLIIILLPLVARQVFLDSLFRMLHLGKRYQFALTTTLISKVSTITYDPWLSQSATLSGVTLWVWPSVELLIFEKTNLMMEHMHVSLSAFITTLSWNTSIEPTTSLQWGKSHFTSSCLTEGRAIERKDIHKEVQKGHEKSQD